MRIPDRTDFLRPLLVLCLFPSQKWVIDGDALARHFRLAAGSVKIINDFVGVGYVS